jgi:signal transduction histidine kinase
MPDPADHPELAWVSAPAGSPVSEPVDILVVDDNPAKLLAISTALAPLGESIVTANSGREALRHLLDREFATVLLDVNMPDLDGFETARMIRSRRRSAATPIIFTSSVNMEETDISRGYSLGAVDYICAPLIPEVLRAKVAVFVQLHRKSVEVRQHAERLEQRTRELEKSKHELRLSERMASVGTLCAGLGHDMGNLLLPLSIWIDEIEKSNSPDLADGIGPLRTCVQYLRKLSAGLRLVSLDPAQDSGCPKVVLDEWIVEIRSVLKNTLPPRATMELDLAPGLPAVAIAPHRLAQVVFNLFQNAGEAMDDPSAGVVRLWATPTTSGDGVRFGVSDNGPGMRPDVLERCTDPFFTTKTRGISTGLGLSLVHGILHRCGARLEIDSTPGRGTTFSFDLPFAQETAESKAWAVVSVSDPRMRALASTLLTASGVRIFPAPPPPDDRAGILVTENDGETDRAAREFVTTVRHAKVFALSEASGESDLYSMVNIAGPLGLSNAVAKFLATLDAESVGPLAWQAATRTDSTIQLGLGSASRS